MRCPHCGEENLSASKVCAVCGNPLPQPTRPVRNPNGPRPAVQGRPANRPAQQRPAGRPTAGRSVPARRKKKTRWNPKFLAACAGILALLILIPILIAVAVHHGDSIESRRIQMFYSGHTGKTNVVLNGKVYEKTISGKVSRTASSRDGLIQAVLSDTGELYYITAQKVDSVASGVLNFVLSADGSKLAYVLQNVPDPSDTSESSTEEETTTRRARGSNNDAAEETTESTTEYVPAGAESFLEFSDTSLFLYNGADGTSPLIGNHVPADSISLSPTGACVAYTVTADDGESFEGFFYREGGATSIGRNALPIAVSDDGMTYYYVKYDNLDNVWIQKLFANNGANEIKLDEFADGNKLSVYLNLDYSQIVYSITGRAGSYFICGADGEKNKISNGYTPIYPYGMREVSSGKAVLTPYESFSKTVFCNAASSAQYLDGKNVSSDLGASGVSFRVSPDGKTVYYLDKDEYLYACTVRKVNKKEVAAHVMTFDLSADGEYLYYVNSDNQLHAVKGNKDTILAENVYTSNTVGLAVTDGGYVYFLQDYSYGSGTLCYVKGDGAIHVLSEINNVHDLAADVGEYIYYRSDFGAISGTYDLYYGKGKKYTKLFEKMG